MPRTGGSDDSTGDQIINSDLSIQLEKITYFLMKPSNMADIGFCNYLTLESEMCEYSEGRGSYEKEATFCIFA